jgi:DNA repair protein RecN (Recombination protein N)
MRQIGDQRQVLCITHLAQVASAAATHFVVTKELKEGRTVSFINRVEGKGRIDELTRMLGGGDAARKHAEAMIRA